MNSTKSVSIATNSRSHYDNGVLYSKSHVFFAVQGNRSVDIQKEEYVHFPFCNSFYSFL